MRAPARHGRTPLDGAIGVRRLRKAFTKTIAALLPAPGSSAQQGNADDIPVSNCLAHTRVVRIDRHPHEHRGGGVGCDRGRRRPAFRPVGVSQRRRGGDAARLETARNSLTARTGSPNETDSSGTSVVYGDRARRAPCAAAYCRVVLSRVSKFVFSPCATMQRPSAPSLRFAPRVHRAIGLNVRVRSTAGSIARTMHFCPAYPHVEISRIPVQGMNSPATRMSRMPSGPIVTTGPL